MPRTLITHIDPKGPYPGTVTANLLDFVFTVCDSANMNEFNFTGRELILAYNIHASIAKTLTLTSVADPQGRTADITAYSLGALEFAAFWAGNLVGWNNSGKFFLTGEDVNLKYAIIRIPG